MGGNSENIYPPACRSRQIGRRVESRPLTPSRTSCWVCGEVRPTSFANAMDGEGEGRGGVPRLPRSFAFPASPRGSRPVSMTCATSKMSARRHRSRAPPRLPLRDSRFKCPVKIETSAPKSSILAQRRIDLGAPIDIPNNLQNCYASVKDEHAVPLPRPAPVGVVRKNRDRYPARLSSAHL